MPSFIKNDRNYNFKTLIAKNEKNPQPIAAGFLIFWRKRNLHIRSIYHYITFILSYHTYEEIIQNFINHSGALFVTSYPDAPK